MAHPLPPLGALPAPSWHRPFFRYFDGDQGGAPGDSHDDDTPDGQEDANDDADQQQNDADDPAGADQLGDPGKKALDAMKAKWKAEKTRADKEAASAAALQAKIDGQEQQHQQEVEAQRIRDEALATANLRLKKAELRAAATGKFADPSDAQTFITLDDIEVDDEGNVDRAAIDAAVDEILTNKPYLAAQSGSRFQGAGDGGARNGSQKPSQLTEAEVKKLAAEGRHAEIVKAKEEGRLDDYLKS